MRRHPELELDHRRCFASFAASRAMTQAYAPLLARRVVVSVTHAGERPQDDVVVPVMLAERVGLRLDESIALHRVLDHLDPAAAA